MIRRVALAKYFVFSAFCVCENTPPSHLFLKFLTCNVLYCVTVDGVLHGMYQSVLSCNNFFLFCFVLF